MNVHEERRSHWSASAMALHASLDMRLVPLQQPGVAVVVGVSVVVITQSSSSSVKSHSQLLRSQLA